MSTIKNVVAGTLESSDIQISISSNTSDQNQIILESQVSHLYGAEIERVIRSILSKHHLQGVLVKAIDKGALNCTIVARMETAIYRATGNQINWELE